MLILGKIWKKEKSSNLDFFISWSLLSRWSSEFTYEVIGSSEKKAEAYITALDDEVEGVYTWIKKYW